MTTEDDDAGIRPNEPETERDPSAVGECLECPKRVQRESEMTIEQEQRALTGATK